MMSKSNLPVNINVVFFVVFGGGFQNFFLFNFKFTIDQLTIL